MPAVLVTGPTPQQWLKPVLTLPTHGGMAQAESTWVPGSVPGWFTRPKMITHPGTNRARRRVTTLMKSQRVTTTCFMTIGVSLLPFSLHCDNGNKHRQP